MKLNLNKDFIQIGILSFSTGFTRIISIILLIILANFLNEESYGLIRYLISISFIFAIPFSGFPVAITKLISSSLKKEDKLKFVFQSSFISIIVFLIEIVMILLLFENKIPLIFMLGSLLIEGIVFGIIRGQLEYKSLYLFQSLISILKIILCFILIKFNLLSVLVICIIYFISTIISSMFVLRKYFPNLNLSIMFLDKKTIKSIIQFAIPVTLSSLSYTIMFNIDNVILKQLSELVIVANYNISRTYAQPLTFIPMAISTLLMPKISNNKKLNEKDIDIGKILKNSMILILISSLLIMIFYLFFGTLIANTFFPKYEFSLITIVILCLSQVFISSFKIYSNAWTAVDKPKMGMWVMVISMIINIVLDIILIPRYLILGASIATLIACFIAFIIISVPFYFYNRKINQKQEKELIENELVEYV